MAVTCNGSLLHQTSSSSWRRRREGSVIQAWSPIQKYISKQIVFTSAASFLCPFHRDSNWVFLRQYKVYSKPYISFSIAECYVTSSGASCIRTLTRYYLQSFHLSSFLKEQGKKVRLMSILSLNKMDHGVHFLRNRFGKPLLPKNGLISNVVEAVQQGSLFEYINVYSQIYRNLFDNKR